MSISLEEADVIIVNQLVSLARRGTSSMCVVCDGTDAFDLLIHFYCREQLICNVTMESPIAGRCVIDLKATANKQSNIADSLPGVHALSGYDTVSYPYGTGKVTAPSWPHAMVQSVMGTFLMYGTWCGQLKWQTPKYPVPHDSRHYLPLLVPSLNTCIVLTTKL